MFATDNASERATSLQDYQNTCSEFVIDISKDYKDWVDRYSLEEKETIFRKTAIDNIVKTTNEWMYKYANSIKKVDIVMNDGISKMAENTAGYPFRFDILLGNMTRYCTHQSGQVKLRVKASPRQDRKVRIGYFEKDNILQVNSSCNTNFTVSQQSLYGGDILDDYIIIDSNSCKSNDIFSITAFVEETKDDYVMERRGFTSLIRTI